eukprot:7383392-Prymnesium_polylepis.3
MMSASVCSGASASTAPATLWLSALSMYSRAAPCATPLVAGVDAAKSSSSSASRCRARSPPVVALQRASMTSRIKSCTSRPVSMAPCSNDERMSWLSHLRTLSLSRSLMCRL